MTSRKRSTQSDQDPTNPDPNDSILPNPEEEKQLLEQSKQETDNLDPMANVIAQEFDSYPSSPGTPKKTNKSSSVQSTLNSWTLVTPKDKMKQLRKVKAKARAAAQEKAEKNAAKKAAKKAAKLAAQAKKAEESESTLATEEKTTYAEKALAVSAVAKTAKSPGDKNEPSAPTSPDTTSPTSATESNSKHQPSSKQKPNISRPFDTYYTLKIKVSASKNSVKNWFLKPKLF